MMEAEEIEDVSTGRSRSNTSSSSGSSSSSAIDGSFLISPDEFKAVWIRCLKELDELMVQPSSLDTWEAIRQNCQTLSNKGSEVWPVMIDREETNLIAEFTEVLDFAAATLHWPKVFTNCLTKILEAYPNVFEENKVDEAQETEEKSLVQSCAYNFLNVAWSICDLHIKGREVCCEDGLIKFILHQAIPKFHNVQLSEDNRYVVAAMAVIYNCVRTSDNIPYYEECNAVDIFLKLKNETEHLREDVVHISALFALGYLINDKNNDVIVPNKELIETVLKYISTALDTDDHVWIFHAFEIADALANMAVNDKNKVMIVEADGAKVFKNMLEEAKDDMERISACKALWSICFVREGREAIAKLPDLLQDLNELKWSENQELRISAEGVLWEVKTDDRVIPEQKESLSSSKPVRGHIMISYNWGHQDAALKISKLLKNRGYNVWIDVDKMEGSIMDAMACAVEESEVILVCMSRKYKLSLNCRSEAEYAYQLRKPIIPLMMEEKFRPDGWLGLLLGSKLWIPFTNPETIDSNVNTLIKHIGSKCTSREEDIIPGHETPFGTGPGETDNQKTDHCTEHPPRIS